MKSHFLVIVMIFTIICVIVSISITPAFADDSKVSISNLDIVDAKGNSINPENLEQVYITSDITNLMTAEQAVFSRVSQVDVTEEIIISQMNGSTQFFFTHRDAISAASTIHESVPTFFLPGKYAIWFLVKDDQNSSTLLAKPVSIIVNVKNQNYTPPQSFITVTTDHPIYHSGDIISVSGIVNSNIQKLPISIFVGNSDKEISHTYTDDNGRYMTTMDSTTLNTGINVLFVRYGNQLHQSTQFELVDTIGNISGISGLYGSSKVTIPEFGTFASALFLISTITTIVISARVRSQRT